VERTASVVIWWRQR